MSMPKIEIHGSDLENRRLVCEHQISRQYLGEPSFLRRQDFSKSTQATL
jgi:hypothetical protein